MSRLAVALLLMLSAVACGDQGTVKPDAAAQPAADAPAAAPPVPLVSSRGTTTPSIPAIPEGAGQGDKGLTWKVPSSWVEETPSSPMRRAQYKVPGDAGAGECVVFYFGPGQGGDPLANAQRWADQFTRADGSPIGDAMKTSTVNVAGLNVFVVEVAGTYKGGMTMSAEPAAPKTGYRLLGAVAPGPDANWYFKLTGPDETVTAQKDAFLSMLLSMKHGAP